MPTIDLDAMSAGLPPSPRVLQRADSLLDLARALACLGEHDRASAACEEAIRLYDLKEAPACATRARKALAELVPEV